MASASSTNEDAEVDRRLAGWTWLAIVLLLAAIAAPGWAGRLYVFDDLGAFHLPLRVFYAVCLQRGEPFDWMPQMYCGWYATGEGQLGGYHPVHYALYRGLSWPTAFQIELLAGYAFLTVGSYVMFRRRLGRSASAYGALVSGFSSFTLLHFAHVNAVAVLAHAPWLLAAQDALWSQRARGLARAGATLAVSLLTASQLLLGYPQYVWFSLLAEVAFLTYHAAASHDRGAALRVIGRWTTAKALGALVAAVQLLPTYDALRDSTRAAATPAFVMSGSLHPANLVQLAAPYALRTRVVGDNTHELGLYCGAVPLALVVWLLARSTTRTRGVVWLSVAALLPVGLALGQYGILYRWQTYLPVVGSFRFPARTICLLQLAVAALAACAWQQLLQRQRASSRPNESNAPLWALAAASALAALVVSVVSPADRLAAWPLVMAGPVLIAAASWLVAQAARGSRAALTALVVFSAIDIGLYGLSYAVYPGSKPADEWLALISRPPGEPHDRVVLNTALGKVPRTRYVGNQALLTGWRRADGYSGLVPALRIDERSAKQARAAGAAWMARPGAWEPIAHPAPRAWVDSPGRSQAQVMHDRPGHIVVRAQTDRPALVVVSERYDRGWRAAREGRADGAVLADERWIGCRVPAGDHVVEFRFDPASLRWGRRLSVLGLVLSLSWFVLGARRASTREPRPSFNPGASPT